MQNNEKELQPNETVENVFENVLSEIETKLGLGGNYDFVISILKEDNNFDFITGVSKLTEQAAQILYDQFDNSAIAFTEKFGDTEVSNVYRIQILLDGKEIDMNLIPNALTEDYRDVTI